MTSPSTALFRTSTAEAREDNVPVMASWPPVTPAERYLARQSMLRHNVAMAREWNIGAGLIRPECNADFHLAQRDWYAKEAADCLREMLFLEVEFGDE